MNSLRAFARSAPRSVSRLTSTSTRSQLCALRRPAAQAWRTPAALPRPAASNFHSSSIAMQVSEELAAKLESEMSMEKDMRDSDAYPPNVQDYVESSEFDIVDTPGQEDVVLTRKFGDEDIKVTFTIADLNNLNEEPDAINDQAMYDEDASDLPEDTQSHGANTKGSVNAGRTPGGNFKVAPEDSVAPADHPELDDVEPAQGEVSFPARLHVRITRASQPGALVIEAVAQDGDIAVENVFFFPEAELADPKTAELEWKRRALYTGPPFGNLDEDLQILIERYLEERGINTSMALFVPDYIEWKEQKEYLGWLDNMKSFVD